jgi:hypothetical protein
MIQDVMNKPLFNIAFSLLLGIGLVAIFRPLCKGSDGQPSACTLDKAPPVKEWDGAVYHLGSKCYEYKTTTVDCPNGKKDYIESFSSEFANRQSHLNAPY